MTRIDWLVVRRLSGRFLITVTVIFSLIVLAESLNIGRLQDLARSGGIALSLIALVTAGARWTLGTLPLTLLIGAILGLLDLQSRRETTIMRSTGISVWRTMRAPIVIVVCLAIFASLVLDTIIVNSDRTIQTIAPQTASGEFWLEETGDNRYVLVAQHIREGGRRIEDVVFFIGEGATSTRLLAPAAELTEGAWFISAGTLYDAEVSPQTLVDYRLPTNKTLSDMSVRVSPVEQLDIFALSRAIAAGISDPELGAKAEMRLYRLIALPIVLVGSLVMAFAFTAGYRRTHKYGVAVLYGIVLGFVVYVVTEIAGIAGGAGVIDPLFAAFAPAIVALVIGTTVLLYREDGRA